MNINVVVDVMLSTPGYKTVFRSGNQFLADCYQDDGEKHRVVKELFASQLPQGGSQCLGYLNLCVNF
ncbi:MAG: hypothetical protein LBG64_02195 [Pseudomonadales bacterium]|jgi:hypothetical protein|nr:hypothetical protein [Pseudomonadales bacterium]